MLIVVQFLDNHVLVILEHLLHLWQIVRLAIVDHDDPLNILETNGLLSHGVSRFLKDSHIHIVKWSYYRHFIHTLRISNYFKYI